METSTPVTPVEQAPNPSEKKSFGEAISYEEVNALRNAQKNAYINGRFENGRMLTSVDNENAAAAQAQAVIDTYLAENLGEDPDDPKLQAARKLLNDYSYVNMSDDKWLHVASYPGVTGKPMSGLENFLRDSESLTNHFDRIDEPTEAENELAEKTDLLKTQRKERRSTVAALAAKRQGHLAGSGGEAYEKAHAEYMESVIEYGKVKNADIIADETLTDVEKQAKIVEYLFKEQAKLRSETIDTLKGTKVGKFVEWMNKGGRAKRFFKGLLIGAGVGAAAAGIGVAAGAVGAVTLGAGVAAVGTAGWRFARGFASADARNKRGMADQTDMAHSALTPEDVKVVEATPATAEQDDLDIAFGALNETDTTAATVTPEATPVSEATPTPEKMKMDADASHIYLEEMTRRFSTVFEHDTKLEQIKRRKSVAWGLGGLALGALAGEAVHLAIDLATPDVMAHVGNGSGTGSQHSFTSGNEADTSQHRGTGSGVDSAPTQPEAPAPTFDTDFNVQSGEGGIHLYQRLGLTEANWYESQNDLLAKFPNDFYDPDGVSGPIAVRLSHPGQLSIAAQEYIKTRFKLS